MVTFDQFNKLIGLDALRNLERIFFKNKNNRSQGLSVEGRKK